MKARRIKKKRNGDNLFIIDNYCPPKKKTLRKKETDIDELISSLASKVSISKSSNFSYQDGLPDFLLPQDDSLEKSSADDYDGIEF